MLKKSMYVYGCFLAIQCLLFSCCNEKTYLVNLQSIEIVNLTDNSQVTTTEGFVLYLNLIYDLEDISMFFNTNINSALATTCPDNIYVYESQITNLNITANTEINGIAAGESLNQIMSFSYYDIENTMDIVEFYNPSETNMNHQKSPDDVLFIFNETIPSQTEFKLTLTIETSNSNIFTTTSNTFIIQ
ncbi:hypothetical protein [uncultured Olleya sp.]|uniref:hypothetical protein n=1 Tax=uncultured Olleya sp. TaxID=757243 RepID=UPI002593547E|nr:hypothetical protein [uncultured Olleya sp.]